VGNRKQKHFHITTHNIHANTMPHTHLVSLAQSKGNFASIIDRLTDESIATSKQERLLDARGLIADHIHHQLHIPRVLDLSDNTHTA